MVEIDNDNKTFSCLSDLQVKYMVPKAKNCVTKGLSTVQGGSQKVLFSF